MGSAISQMMEVILADPWWHLTSPPAWSMATPPQHTPEKVEPVPACVSLCPPPGRVMSSLICNFQLLRHQAPAQRLNKCSREGKKSSPKALGGHFLLIKVRIKAALKPILVKPEGGPGGKVASEAFWGGRQGAGCEEGASAPVFLIRHPQVLVW